VSKFGSIFSVGVSVQSAIIRLKIGKIGVIYKIFFNTPRA
jgi:hypothetical protein